MIRKMKRNDIYLLAFLAILVNGLLSGFTIPAVLCAGLILGHLGISGYLTIREKVEDNRSLVKKFEDLEKDLKKTKEELSGILDDKLSEVNVRMAKVENSSKMANFQLKK
jgi:hypothetical protein